MEFQGCSICDHRNRDACAGRCSRNPKGQRRPGPCSGNPPLSAGLRCHPDDPAFSRAGAAGRHDLVRIAIHATDANTWYVAAVGRLWGPSKERGVYKSTDGGKTWSNVLFVNEDTGGTDIAMGHQSPGTLIAAAYQRRR